MLHSWLCTHAYQISHIGLFVRNLIRMECHAAQPHRLLHPCYGMAMPRITHCIRVQWTDYTGSILKYSRLFSTAMDDTALGGASDHNHLMYDVKPYYIHAHMLV